MTLADLPGVASIRWSDSAVRELVIEVSEDLETWRTPRADEAETTVALVAESREIMKRKNTEKRRPNGTVEK